MHLPTILVDNPQFSEWKNLIQCNELILMQVFIGL